MHKFCRPAEKLVCICLPEHLGVSMQRCLSSCRKWPKFSSSATAQSFLSQIFLRGELVTCSSPPPGSFVSLCCQLYLFAGLVLCLVPFCISFQFLSDNLTNCQTFAYWLLNCLSLFFSIWNFAASLKLTSVNCGKSWVSNTKHFMILPPPPPPPFCVPTQPHPAPHKHSHTHTLTEIHACIHKLPLHSSLGWLHICKPATILCGLPAAYQAA